jgi:hypothetical protein
LILWYTRKADLDCSRLLIRDKVDQNSSTQECCRREKRLVQLQAARLIDRWWWQSASILACSTTIHQSMWLFWDENLRSFIAS